MKVRTKEVYVERSDFNSVEMVSQNGVQARTEKEANKRVLAARKLVSAGALFGYRSEFGRDTSRHWNANENHPRSTQRFYVRGCFVNEGKLVGEA